MCDLIQYFTYILRPGGVTVVTGHGWIIKGMMVRKYAHTITSILSSIKLYKKKNLLHTSLSSVFPPMADTEKSCFIVKLGLSNITAHGSMQQWEINTQEVNSDILPNL